jgi:sensor histidine kinase YesM
MNNKKILYWTSQLLGWLLYYVIIGLNLASSNTLNQKAISLLLIMYIGSILITNLLRRFFIHKKYVDLKIQQIIPRAIIACILAGITLKFYQIVVDRLIIHYNENPINYTDVVLDMLGSSILIFLWVVFYFAYQFFNKSRQQEIKNLQWESLQNQIELNNLKSQLNPHFMFNSLNSIRALIDIDKKNAKESITKLSTLLRTSLLMGKKNVVSIEEEIDLVKNYLDLEKIRFEERLKVDIRIDNEANSVEIPPLMIQTLAENSIKHGISKLMEGGTISISAAIKDKTCLIEVKNPGVLTYEEDDQNSIGLKNTKDRLRLMFDKKAKFELNQEGEFVIARISIKPS